jgi:hypothetical protein
MAQPPDPPEVTIVDPSSPAGTADLLGGRHPWRPTRRQRVAITVVVVVAALVAGATAVLQHRHHEHVLDLAAERAVAFSVESSRDEPDWTHQPLVLINEGPTGVRVLDVAFVGAGYPAGRVDTDVASTATLPLAVPLGTTCPLSLLDSAAHQLRVHARTSRDTVVTRLLDLSQDLAGRLAGSERGRCRLYRVEEAVRQDRSALLRRQGDAIVATITLSNQGRLPVTLTSLSTGPWLRATTALPQRLPGRNLSGTVHTLTMRVVLRIDDCARLVESIRPGEEPVDTLGRVLGPFTLRFGATNGHRTGVVLADVSDLDVAVGPGAPPRATQTSVLQGVCPDLPRTVVM